MHIVQTNICFLLQPAGWTAVPPLLGEPGGPSVCSPVGSHWAGILWCVCGVWCVSWCVVLSAMNGTSVDGISINNEKLSAALESSSRCPCAGEVLRPSHKVPLHPLKGERKADVKLPRYKEETVHVPVSPSWPLLLQARRARRGLPTCWAPWDTLLPEAPGKAGAGCKPRPVMPFKGLESASKGSLALEQVEPAQEEKQPGGSVDPPLDSTSTGGPAAMPSCAHAGEGRGARAG